MRYMNFNRSCSYTCLANMLDSFGFDKEDTDIVKEMKLAYLFYYDDNSGYMSGPMLQNKIWFDLFLNRYKYEYVKEKCSKEDMIELLKATTKEVMLGLNGIYESKHAVVFKGFKKDKFTFLNPHREEDGENDFVVFTQEDLETKLEDMVDYGYLRFNSEITTIDYELFLISSNFLSKFLVDLIEYISKPISLKEFNDKREYLFTAFFLISEEMMGIEEDNELRDQLIKLKNNLLLGLKSSSKEIELNHYILYEDIVGAIKSFNLKIQETYQTFTEKE